MSLPMVSNFPVKGKEANLQRYLKSFREYLRGQLDIQFGPAVPLFFISCHLERDEGPRIPDLLAVRGE